MIRPPPPNPDYSLPPEPPPVPWSPSMGRRAAPSTLRLAEEPDLAADARTPAERELLIQYHQRRSAVRATLRRAAAAIALALVVSASMLWSTAQPWWSPALLAHLPDPVRIAHWLLRPDLTALPGLPAEWNPWTPLTLEEPESMLTRWKISRLENDREACQAWLAAAPGTDQTPLPDHADPSTLLCGWKAASRINRLDGVRFSSPFTLACGAAVALARWERHALQPAAREHLGTEVVRIEHLGSYACRTIGSGAEGPLSTHASANALDIAGFTLADGRRIGVEQNWKSADRPLVGASENAAFLLAARDGACGSFNAVLGPDYNAAHHDHFHLDRGAYRVCR